MTDYLADVVMPPTPMEEPQSPTSSPITEPPSPTNRIMEDQMSLTDQPHMDGESQIEIEYGSGGETQEEEEEQLIPEPEKRKKIPQEEIFSAPKVKTILEPPTPSEDVHAQRPTKKPKQTRKKRGPASEEQLARLAKGRAKAQETRARKKKEKEEKVAKEKSDKELVEAVRERERKKLRKKLETPIEDELPQQAVKIVEKPVVVEKGYSQEDLDDAVARAVEQSVQKVEILRKRRKEVKKQAEAKAKHDAHVFKEINTAMKNDVWANCFV